MKRRRAENAHGLFSVNARMIRDPQEAAIKQYIADHQFGPQTPPLRKTLSAAVFKQHYYDKQELMDFCRSVGISTCGLKQDLNDRISLFLQTGCVTVVETPKKSSRPDSEMGLSTSQVVVNYKSDPTTRAFFEKHIPEFTGFSALVQKQIKERLAAGEVFTYGDVIEMHQSFLRNKESAKANGTATKVAHESCQFNQFFIDYKHDPDVKVHSNMEAWILVRDSAGEKTYQRYKNRIGEIRAMLQTPTKSLDAQVVPPALATAK